MQQTINRLKKSVETNPEALKDLEKVVSIAVRSLELLVVCQAQVGMVTGAEIQELLAEAKNEKFNERDYHFERIPEGQ